jgi:hypothetical protein
MRKLGGDLATARKRRKDSLKSWAQRLNISVPTLMKLEKGDPTVSMGVYVTALWLINRHQALGQLADPVTDDEALENEVSSARMRHRRKGLDA